MLLTPEQVAEADKLGLTYLEYGVALRSHIDPGRYAARKAEIQAERARWDAKMAALEAWAVENAPASTGVDAGEAE